MRFTDPVLIADLAQTLAGNRDREAIAARRTRLDTGLAFA
jgi:hypothetical protein